MIIISGKLHVVDRDSYLEGCRKVVEQARSAPGCLDFALSADLLDPARINVYERWESDAALETFRGAGTEEGQAAQILDAEVARYRVCGVEAP
ncbi:antibiotic biosynthesis monooxygenase family protein [Sphaerisporangium sp. B11E5]|uniref:putative quinol monooxygenase n=1 Tax=Sphaerisporangium sp. B11E5 TaxID=3153563 RepID=UPI00325CDB69